MTLRTRCDATQLQRMNTLLQAALALPPHEREGWLLALPADVATLVPLLRSLLQRAAADDDAFMRFPAASLG